MPRQRPDAVGARRRPRAAIASRSSFGDEDGVLLRRAARVGDRRRQLPDDAERALPPARRPPPSGPATRYGRVAVSNCSGDAERLAQAFDDALDVEEVDLARAARPVFGATAPVQAIATPRVSPRGGEARADLEQPDVAPAVAPVVRDGVDQAGQQRRPQRVELRRRAGWRCVDELRRRRRSKSAAAFASMKPNVTASERPAAVSTRRTQAGRAAMRGSGAGAGCVSTGNVASSLSNP